MRWFPDLANAAFCETVELRRKILERQLSILARQGLEPSSAEFIAALAAGNNSHVILQVGCGISTLALAVAAQVTGGLLVSIHTDVSKQDIVRYHLDYLGLLASVELLVTSEPNNVLLTRKNVDFAHFTGNPKDYIQLFDSLNLSCGAIVAADNALSDASIEYIRHVRQQLGVESSTLPLARGIEVTKLVSWEKFKSGQMLYSGLCEGVMKERDNEANSVPCASEETPTLTKQSTISGVKQSTSTSNQTFEIASLGASSIGSPNETFTSCDTCTSSPSGSSITLIVTENPFMQSITTDDLFANHDVLNIGSDGVLKSPCSSDFEVHFRNFTTETEVTITGVNRDMLLSDITSAFSEMGISVKTANIETHEDLIEDVFYVTDTKSRAPIHPSQWKSVRERVLARIGKRHVTQSFKS